MNERRVEKPAKPSAKRGRKPRPETKGSFREAQDAIVQLVRIVERYEGIARYAEQMRNARLSLASGPPNPGGKGPDETDRDANIFVTPRRYENFVISVAPTIRKFHDLIFQIPGERKAAVKAAVNTKRVQARLSQLYQVASPASKFHNPDLVEQHEASCLKAIRALKPDFTGKLLDAKTLTALEDRAVKKVVDEKLQEIFGFSLRTVYNRMKAAKKPSQDRQRWVRRGKDDDLVVLVAFLMRCLGCGDDFVHEEIAFLTATEAERRYFYAGNVPKDMDDEEFEY